MVSATLYELADSYLSILEQIEEREQEIRDAGGVLPSDLQEALEQIEGDTREKIRNVVKMLKHLDHLAEGRRAEAAAMEKSARSTEARRDWLYDHLMREMERLGIQREDGWPPVRIQTNGNVSASVDINRVPPEYVFYPTPKPHFDREAFMRDAKEAKALPEGPGTVEWQGVTLTRGKHLRY